MEDAGSFIRRLYDAEVESRRKGGCSPLSTARHRRHYLSATLAAACDRDEVRREAGLEAGFWFDPLTGEGGDPASAVIHIVNPEAETVLAEVALTANDARFVIHFVLVRTKMGWRIDDIDSKDWMGSVAYRFAARDLATSLGVRTRRL